MQILSGINPVSERINQSAAATAAVREMTKTTEAPKNSPWVELAAQAAAAQEEGETDFLALSQEGMAWLEDHEAELAQRQIPHFTHYDLSALFQEAAPQAGPPAAAPPPTSAPAAPAPAAAFSHQTFQKVADQSRRLNVNEEKLKITNQILSGLRTLGETKKPEPLAFLQKGVLQIKDSENIFTALVEETRKLNEQMSEQMNPQKPEEKTAGDRASSDDRGIWRQESPGREEKAPSREEKTQKLWENRQRETQKVSADTARGFNVHTTKARQ